MLCKGRGGFAGGSGEDRHGGEQVGFLIRASVQLVRLLQPHNSGEPLRRISANLFSGGLDFGRALGAIVKLETHESVKGRAGHLKRALGVHHYGIGPEL